MPYQKSNFFIYDKVNNVYYTREQVDEFVEDGDDECTRYQLRRRHDENVACGTRRGSGYIHDLKEKFSTNDINEENGKIDQVLAKLDDFELLRNIGLYYIHSGSGQLEDKLRGVQILTRAAEGGVMLAWYDLCLVYRYGEGVNCDSEKAHACHQRAAEMDCEIALFELGLGFEDGHLESDCDEKRAAYCFRRLHDLGLKCSILKLGTCYLRGAGVRADVPAGVRFVLQACENGNWTAMMQAAKLYEHGFGVKQDLNQSLGYIQRAADCKSGRALFQLARYYAAGYIFEMDHEKAFQHCKEAADAGYDEAVYALACMYGNGVHVEKDEERGVQLMKRAADLGHADASRIMAERYEYGKGVAKNVDKAAELFSKASAYGDAEATYRLGVMYDKGIGVEKDEAAALEHYKQAADEGIVDALTEVTARTFQM